MRFLRDLVHRIVTSVCQSIYIFFSLSLSLLLYYTYLPIYLCSIYLYFFVELMPSKYMCTYYNIYFYTSILVESIVHISNIWSNISFICRIYNIAPCGIAIVANGLLHMFSAMYCTIYLIYCTIIPYPLIERSDHMTYDIWSRHYVLLWRSLEW